MAMFNSELLVYQTVISLYVFFTAEYNPATSHYASIEV